MSITTHFYVKQPVLRAGLQPRRRWNVLRPLAVLALAGGTAFGAQQLIHVLESPGHAIRGDLRSAAADARTLPFQATPAEVQQAIAPDFPGYDVAVDARGFPVSISVTLNRLDRRSCLDASRTARRLEGSVVVELIGYGSPADCRQRNDMTWRIMP